jgi:nitroreductase
MTQLPNTFFRRLATPIDLLESPGPSDQQLDSVICASANVPDHGNLKPWRIHVIDKAEQKTLSELRLKIYKIKYPNREESIYQAEGKKFLRSPTLLIVKSAVNIESSIPVAEQILSGGAFCQNLLLGFNAIGFGAKWVTGWPAYDSEFLAQLNLKTPNQLLAFIHIGTPKKNIYADKKITAKEIIEDFPSKR